MTRGTGIGSSTLALSPRPRGIALSGRFAAGDDVVMPLQPEPIRLAGHARLSHSPDRRMSRCRQVGQAAHLCCDRMVRVLKSAAA